MLKYLYYFLISLFLCFLSQSIFSAVISPEKLNILIVFLVFITFIRGWDVGFVFAVSMGLIINIYSYLPLGTYIVIYSLVILAVEYLHKQIFINFSYSTNIILILLSTVLYNILLVTANIIFYLLGVTEIYIRLDSYFLSSVFIQIINNLILASITFIFARAIFKKLNLAILTKR